MTHRQAFRLREFYRALEKKEKLSYPRALAIFEALWREAVSLRAIHSKNVLEGLEVDLRIARILNASKP